jgi:hypothetical protein
MIIMNKILVVSVITILVLGSVLSVGLYMLTTPNDDDQESKNIFDYPDDGTLPAEILMKWDLYTKQVDSPEIIKTDPDIAHVSPGEQLEKLAYLEGLNNFTDSYQGSSGLNTSQENYAMDGGDDELSERAPSADAEKGAGEGAEEREVEEADLVKVIDDKLYVLNSYRGLIIIDIADPAEAYIEGQCSVIGSPEEMYVVDFLALITVRTSYNFWYKYWEMDGTLEDDSEDDSSETGAIGTMIYIVNVKNPAKPKILKIVELEGFAAESRRVGHVIYQATNTYNWYGYDYDSQETIVSSIDFGDPETVGMKDQVRFEGSSNQVHASSTAFYVAQPVYEDDKFWSMLEEERYYTEVTYLDISDPDGEIEQRDTFRSPGYLDNKYQMDEYNKMFRMVTHFWTGIGESKLYIFDISNTDDIKQMSSLLVDDAGNLMATRFAGERAYTIHLPRSIDPLDVLDLSDPYNPKLCDVFEMPGWVTHMEVRGMKILALGVDDSEGERNVAVSLFDVTDPYNAVMQDRERLGGKYAYSSANWEPKALTIDDTHNIVIVPFQSYSDGKRIAGVQIVQFDLTQGELTLRGMAESSNEIERTRVVGDYILATSFRTLQVVDIDNLDEPEVVKIIDLCLNIQDIIPVEKYFLQMIQDDYNNKRILRTVKNADDLEAIDTVTIESMWGKLFDTSSGIFLATNEYLNQKTTSILYKVTTGTNGDISITNIGQLPDNVIFRDYNDYYYYYDEMDMIGVRSIALDMPYYYDDYNSERFIIMENAILYYHIGNHPYVQWEYNSTTGQRMPIPQEKGTDTLYIFDLSDLSSGAKVSSVTLDTYNLQTLMKYKDMLYVQHRQNDIEVYDKSGYYYYNSYYKNYVMVVDCSDLSEPAVIEDYNVPGKLIGAGEGVLFTLSEWYDHENNATLNTLTLRDGTAEITSAVKIGTGNMEVVMYKDKAYIVNRPQYYYYYYRDNSEYDQNTTFQVIDLSVPGEPVLELSANLEGRISIEAVEDGHIIMYDETQSSMVVYATDAIPVMEFEAMVLLQGYYNDFRVYKNAIYIPQGYYGVIDVSL